MKKIILIFTILISTRCLGQTTVSYKTEPCKVDTITGVLFWHSKEHYDQGNTWDTAYWVGMCGAIGIQGSITFIPGQMKITQGVKDNDRQKYWRYEERMIEHGAFYDANWKKIPSKDVYGMIPIQKKKAF